MSDLFAMRRECIRLFDVAIPTTPHFAPESLTMWENMLHEEWQEFQQALADYKAHGGEDVKPSTHAMAELTAEGIDVLNVVIGLLLSQGMPVEAMAQAIHDANLRKCIDGQLLRRADGKVIKPPGWQPADKESIIRQAKGL